MIHVHKTAIAIPNEDFEQIENFRRETGKSRSRLLVEAFRAWRDLQKKEAQEKLYERAYRQKPENMPVIKAGLKAGLAVWGKESW